MRYTGSSQLHDICRPMRKGHKLTTETAEGAARGSKGHVKDPKIWTINS